jgi:hypothetical protein
MYGWSSSTVLRVVTTEEEAQLHARQVTWVYSSSIPPFQSSLSLSWESRPGCKIDKLTSAPSSASTHRWLCAVCLAANLDSSRQAGKLCHRQLPQPNEPLETPGVGGTAGDRLMMICCLSTSAAHHMRCNHNACCQSACQPHRKLRLTQPAHDTRTVEQPCLDQMTWRLLCASGTAMPKHPAFQMQKTGKHSKAATASSRVGSKPHEISHALLTAIGTLILFTNSHL